MIRVGPGNPSGVSAAPPGITDNYYSVGPNNPDNATGLVGTANFSATPLKYFGFYMGSPDTYNVVEVYNGASLLALPTPVSTLPPPPELSLTATRASGCS